MESTIIKTAATQGLWALLFVSLLFYVLRRNDAREEKYQSIIDKLSDKLGVIEEIKSDVEEIKAWLEK